MNTQVVCYHSVDEFLSNLKEFDVSSNPYGSYAYLSVFLKYHPSRNFYFFDIFEDGKKIAIVPFECSIDSKLFNVKYFRFVGYMKATNYEQYICRDEDMEKVHRIFIDFLEKQDYKVLINYYDINSASPLYKILKESELKKSANQLYVCPCLRFTDDFDEFFKGAFPAAKKRTELKKFQRKLTELGNLKMVNINDEVSYKQNIVYIDQIYRVHSERFADVYATSFFGSPTMRPYYSELIETLMKDSKGFLSLLVLDDITIAFILCLTNGEVLVDWIPAFDPSFSKYSLGIVQYKMLFEDLCSSKYNYKVFDYSKGSSVYKRKWAKEETWNYQYIVSLKGQNLFSACIYIFERNRFRFKCYLRRKGVLKKAKLMIGKVLAWRKKDFNLNTDIERRFSEEPAQQTFNYGSIINNPVNVREDVLNSLYNGVKLLSIQQEGDKIVITYSKQP